MNASKDSLSMLFRTHTALLSVTLYQAQQAKTGLSATRNAYQAEKINTKSDFRSLYDTVWACQGADAHIQVR